jgi:hypothetical protein
MIAGYPFGAIHRAFWSGGQLLLGRAAEGIHAAFPWRCGLAPRGLSSAVLVSMLAPGRSRYGFMCRLAYSHVSIQIVQKKKSPDNVRLGTFVGNRRHMTLRAKEEGRSF